MAAFAAPVSRGPVAPPRLAKPGAPVARGGDEEVVGRRSVSSAAVRVSELNGRRRMAGTATPRRRAGAGSGCSHRSSWWLRSAGASPGRSCGRRKADGLDAWLADEAAAGRQWTCADRSVGGYPFRLEVSCRTLTFRRGEATPSSDPCPRSPRSIARVTSRSALSWVRRRSGRPVRRPAVRPACNGTAGDPAAAPLTGRSSRRSCLCASRTGGYRSARSSFPPSGSRRSTEPRACGRSPARASPGRSR